MSKWMRLMMAAALAGTAACGSADESGEANVAEQSQAELAEPPVDLSQHPDLANQAAASEAADAAVGGDLNAEEVSAAGNVR